ncbi:MAG: sigma-70 family RNA polymerase sigma factor [Polyangiaceae bacterium]|nr:sigma-70 family RNA polymerase sigma factor [Polyangiaceae bacterium]
MRASWDRTALSTYRAALESRTPLTADTERELTAKLQAGDATAGGKLVRACMPFVLTVSLEYRRWGVPLEDIVQEGSIGLLKAAMRFNPDKGCRLITYAAYWIRAEIRDYVVRSYRMVRLGASKGERRALRHYRKTRERDPQELALASGISPQRAELLLPMLMARDVTLDASDSGEPSPGDRLADIRPSPEEETATSEERSKMSAALEVAIGELPPREQTIIRTRWLREDPLTLEEVGHQFGISKERVRQLEERAKKRVRDRIVALMAPEAQAAA